MSFHSRESMPRWQDVFRPERVPAQPFFQGMMADRPAAENVPLNFTFFAADLGVVYCNLEDGWHQAGADQILYSAFASGHVFVLDMVAGATNTYPGA